MQCRKKRYAVGDWVTVKGCYQYQLPKGLAEGARVKVIGSDIGTHDVEDEAGNIFQVSIVCIQSSWEYQGRNGEWADENDPRLIKRLAELRSLRTPPTF